MKFADTPVLRVGHDTPRTGPLAALGLERPARVGHVPQREAPQAVAADYLTFLRNL